MSADLGLRKVALMTACSLADVIRRGRPARGRVRNPASPWLR
jgi:hypothetical protein